MFWENFREYALSDESARREPARHRRRALARSTPSFSCLAWRRFRCGWQRHAENARRVAEFLTEHPEVAWVSYPIFPNNPWTDLASKYVPEGPGAVFTFGVKGGFEAGRRVHRQGRAGLPSGQRRGCQDTRDPSRQHHPPAGAGRGAASRWGRRRDDSHLGGHGGHRRHPLGPGSGVGRGLRNDHGPSRGECSGASPDHPVGADRGTRRRVGQHLCDRPTSSPPIWSEPISRCTR